MSKEEIKKLMPSWGGRESQTIYVFECLYPRLACGPIAFDKESFAQGLIHEYLRGTYDSAKKVGDDWHYFVRNYSQPIATLRKMELYSNRL